MTTSSEHLQVKDNAAQQRFEVKLDEGLAYAEYQPQGDLLAFTHTEVPPRYEGQGVGSKLLRGALDQVRERGQQVLPFCPFVTAFIQRHPEYRDLVPAGEQPSFGL